MQVLSVISMKKSIEVALKSPKYPWEWDYIPESFDIFRDDLTDVSLVQSKGPIS